MQYKLLNLKQKYNSHTYEDIDGYFLLREVSLSFSRSQNYIRDKIRNIVVFLSFLRTCQAEDDQDDVFQNVCLCVVLRHI